MIRRLPALIGLLLIVGPALHAQSRGAGPEAVFARAQALVSRGNAAAGRTLVDSVLVNTPVESAVYPEALFWRASFAAVAADAERDYRRLAVEYPLSQRSEDALTRLAQMELARGDRESAARHLDRLLREHPASKTHARTAYWLARVRFEQTDVRAGCAAIADARASVGADDAELRNQIDYLGKRCDSGATVSSTSSGSTPASPPVPSSGEPDSKTPRAPASPTPATTPRASTPASATARAFAVQVAAYPQRAPAEKLVKQLATRGYTARVEGTRAPFRVRVGHFSTRDAATAYAARLRKAGIEGMVVGDVR